MAAASASPAAQLGHKRDIKHREKWSAFSPHIPVWLRPFVRGHLSIHKVQRPASPPHGVALASKKSQAPCTLHIPGRHILAAQRGNRDRPQFAALRAADQHVTRFQDMAYLSPSSQPSMSNRDRGRRW
eukprot:scaffold14275_cov107-Isochrysis_galbana.AAC.6